MDFILDNIKIFIVIGAAVLWVIGKIAEAKKKQQEQQPWSPPEEDGYEPADWDAAPAYPHAPVPPPLPRVNVPPPVAHGEDRELARQRAMQDRLATLRQERAAVGKAARASTKAARAARAARASWEPTVSSSSLKASLRERGTLRRAIVMREILDPPVGLR